MTLKNPFKPLTPHGERRLFVHFVLIILAGIIMFCASCRPQRGCYGTKGMSGYGWIKCKQTGKVCILAPDGEIVEIYYEPST